MTRDIVARLRNLATTKTYGLDKMWSGLREAADEIEELRAEVERLQAESEAFRGKLAEQCGQTLVARAEVEQLAGLLKNSEMTVHELLANDGRLLDALKAIECHSIDHTDACRMAGKARALERRP